MFGIGGTELVIILVFGFLLFGPDKLPQMGRTIGRALRQFNETREKMTSVVQSEVIDPMAAAAQAPVAPKKSGKVPTGATTDDDDLDADIADAAIDDQPRRRETFAERRARLAAEKAAKAEGASAAGDGSAAGDPSTSGAGAPSAQDDKKGAGAGAAAAQDGKKGAGAGAAAGDPSTSGAGAPSAQDDKKGAAASVVAAQDDKGVAAASASAQDASAMTVAEEAAEVRTTADLYARRPRKHKPSNASEGGER